MLFWREEVWDKLFTDLCLMEIIFMFKPISVLLISIFDQLTLFACEMVAARESML